ncbi:MAG: family 16 glycoside hydrolase, partial [Bacteroidota bacterium]
MKKRSWPVLLAFFAFWACGSPEDSSPPPPPSKPAVMTALPGTEITLNDLAAFDAPDANWRIVGQASAPWDKEVERFSSVPGTGLLINEPSETAKSALRSKMEYGDLELSFEFMMPKGSNSGVYLQGRYEVQLLDSWGKTELSHGDCGGIYQRWDDSKPEGQKGYEGTPPALNASRAPGLWQSMKIRFQAPRFDADGNKTANARMLSVVHNGKQIHRDVELSGPTRGSFFAEEAAMGPFIIQGDHGPVAFRKMEYKSFGDNRVTFKDLRYSFYEVKTDKRKVDLILEYDLTTMQAKSQGSVDTISRHQAARRDNHILHYEGTIVVPETGPYLFKAKVGGGLLLKIDGMDVVEADGERGYNDLASILSRVVISSFSVS